MFGDHPAFSPGIRRLKAAENALRNAFEADSQMPNQYTAPKPVANQYPVQQPKPDVPFTPIDNTQITPIDDTQNMGPDNRIASTYLKRMMKRFRY